MTKNSFKGNENDDVMFTLHLCFLDTVRRDTKETINVDICIEKKKKKNINFRFINYDLIIQIDTKRRNLC